MHLYIKEIEAGDFIKGVYIVRSAQMGQTQKNEAFWSIRLSDSTGQIDTKIWSPLASSIKDVKISSFVSIEAKAQKYKDNVQLTISSLRVLDEEEVNVLDLSAFVALSPCSPIDMRAELDDLIKTHITHTPWQKLIKCMFEDPRIAPYFEKATAAKSMHHAYMHGLLEHSLNVCKNCLAIANLYPEVDKQIVIVAALFHDLGKIEELSGVLATEYTDAGKLIGHTLIGLEILNHLIGTVGLEEHLITHLRHLILSHHGEYEFGAPKTPLTAEAWVLHYSDNIDSKLNQCLSLAEPNEESKIVWFAGSYNRQFCRILSSPNIENSEGQKNFFEEECVETSCYEIEENKEKPPLADLDNEAIALLAYEQSFEKSVQSVNVFEDTYVFDIDELENFERMQIQELEKSEEPFAKDVQSKKTRKTKKTTAPNIEKETENLISQKSTKSSKMSTKQKEATAQMSLLQTLENI